MIVEGGVADDPFINVACTALWSVALGDRNEEWKFCFDDIVAAITDLGLGARIELSGTDGVHVVVVDFLHND
jgi:hypothetical protein